VKFITTLFYGIVLTFCSTEESVLERVRDAGVLNVASRYSETTYYEGPNGKTGLEYDLAKRFADELELDLNIIVPENFDEILPMVEAGDVHFAAAGLTVTELRKQKVRFGPTYQQITQQLVYRQGRDRPKTMRALQGATLEVIAGSSHVERLNELQAEIPGLTWHENSRAESSELLELVWNKLLDYTIADSNEVARSRRYRPELLVAFDVSQSQDLAWAFPRSTDDSLYIAAVGFFNRIRKSGELQQLTDRHYGHVKRMDFVSTQTFLSHAMNRLPDYRHLFEKAAEKHAIDWRLLAAVSYQESLWKPRAKSPTGVRGLMMLTKATAEQMEVDNRLDPEQSILGGAKYLAYMHDKIPERIPEPDRTWMALAAYNVGYGHLEDARRLTEQQSADPDRWIDVKNRLPLLSKKKYFSKTRHGYARGNEPVSYVSNIRRFYDLILWLDESEGQKTELPPLPRVLESPVL